MLRRDALAALVLTTSLAATMPGALAQDRGQQRPQVRIAAGVGGPWVMEFAAPFSPSGVVLGARTPDSAAGVQSASLGNRAIQPGRPIDPQFLPQDVIYSGREKPGTIVMPSASITWVPGPARFRMSSAAPTAKNRSSSIAKASARGTRLSIV